MRRNLKVDAIVAKHTDIRRKTVKLTPVKVPATTAKS
jgi:hypothetical protein